MKKFFALIVLAIVGIAIATAATYSGSLPVMFINTEGGAPVDSKENYVDATYYLDPMGVAGVEAIGTKDEPLALKIKGRGNYTWTGFDKKPYRLKLDSKAALLGMKKSKHFGLLAHADDDSGFLRNTVGFELSRRLGLAWTPAQEPIEVVLNGDYLGLYMLTELIRVDEDRVNIVEQADNETDPSLITGGWLVEIDNYDEAEEEQVRFQEGNGEVIRFTHKSPELLSDIQRNYLLNLGRRADAAIYVSDKNDTGWENIIDIDALARFYIVQEILDNAESFHGSCYWHKDLGNDTKMVFGPVWDFGNTFHRGGTRFIYDRPPYGQTWIGEIAKFPHFQEVVKQIWKEFKANEYASLDAFIDAFSSQITQAAASDYQRWPQYGVRNVQSAKNDFKQRIHDRVNWLVQQWGNAQPAPGPVNECYLIGQVNDNSWEYNVGVALTKTADGIFSGDVTFAQNVYFGVATTLSATSWGDLNDNYRYGPVGGNEIVVGQEMDMMKTDGADPAWKMNAGGKFTVTVDFNALTIKVEESEGPGPIIDDDWVVWFEKPEDWATAYAYVYHRDNGGSANIADWPGEPMTHERGNLYSYRFTMHIENGGWILFNDAAGNQTAGDPGFVLYDNGLYNFDGYQGEYSSVATVNATEGLKVTVEGNSIVLEATAPQSLAITTIDGRHRVISVPAGRSVVSDLPAGFYIVGRRKVIIR